MSDDQTFDLWAVRAEMERADEVLLDKWLPYINEHFVLPGFEPYTRDQIAILPVRASTGHLDTYGTMMGRSTLRNFTRLASVPGVGLPFMRAHASGAPFKMNYAEDPHGRVFYGEYAEDEVPFARELAYFDLTTSPNGRPNDRFVRQMTHAGQREVSVGLTMNPVVAPGARLMCNLCGQQMFPKLKRSTCSHMPLIEYDVEKDGPDGKKVREVVRCTATFEDAGQTEVSSVWKAATPGALVERAIGLHAEGQLSRADAQLLEDTYQRSIIQPNRTTWPVPAGPVQPKEASMTTGTKPNEVLTALLGDRATQIELYDTDPVAGAVKMLEKERADVEQALEHEKAERQAERDRLAKALGLADGEAIMDGVDRLKSSAAVGEQYRERLIEDLIAESVRAFGAEMADADAEREKAKFWSIPTLEREIKRLRQHVAAQFQPGRVTDKIVGQRTKDEEPLPTNVPSHFFHS